MSEQLLREILAEVKTNSQRMGGLETRFDNLEKQFDNLEVKVDNLAGQQQAGLRSMRIPVMSRP